MEPGRFFAELKRRNVYRVAVAYAVVAWLLIQIATQVFPFFDIPNWAVRLVVLLLALGFPVAVSRVGVRGNSGRYSAKATVAGVYATFGDAERALPFLEQALSSSYHTSITRAHLRLDPVWDPIRNDPRFQKLMVEKPKP